MDLSKIATTPPEDLDKSDIKDQTKDLAKKIGDLHELMIADGQYSLLVIFQGMDASGKDGAVRNVFRYCTHNNFGVYSFKKPTEEEFAHDFLWRVHKQCPAKGNIQVFNRSHYEDILIQRVHQWITEDQVSMRMQAINAFEKLLQADANTVILKFFLHISYDQQTIELQQRIDERDKNWKHNANDWKERENWSEYMRCYEYVLENSLIPWQIIPVDDRWYRDYLVSKAIVEALEKLPMEYPKIES